ncbi:MAG: zinc ABC transporter substrate-binding protein [Deltaproteobacteria bacterium]|nr:zinc ABC transporter substrate-binding protein [Deltaproteobacteria bacterium]
MKTKARPSVAILLTFLISSLLAPVHGVAATPVKVVVSILPQKYFLQKIGGEFVDVSVMVLPGANPATYEPKARQMAALTKAKIYFAIGVPFEKRWLPRFAKFNSKMVIVHTEEGIEKVAMKSFNPGSRKSRSAGIKDPHVWLSPPLVMIQARNILRGLVKVDREHRQVYETNYKNFILELVNLDLEIQDMISADKAGGVFMVYHPSWGYFAKTYGLRQVSIEMEGKEPSPKQLETLIRFAINEGINVIFVQPEFSTKSALTIAGAIKAKVAPADPLALNWADNLRKVAREFVSALK